MKHILSNLVARRSLVLCFTLVACLKQAGATVPATSPAEVTRLDRGVQLRVALLDTLDSAYDHDSNWPERAVGGNSRWQYTNPGHMNADQTTQFIISSATVVVEESLTEHPDGVWVGYADGHLEFAASASAIVDCHAQLAIAKRAVIAQNAEQQHPSTLPVEQRASGELHLKVIDPAGTPVAGAAVGTFGLFGDRIPNNEGLRAFPAGRDELRLSTDDHGAVTVSADAAFAQKFENRNTVPIWVLDKRRELIGRLDFTRADFAAGAEKKVALQSVCRVQGHVTELGLRRPIAKTIVLASRPGLLSSYSSQCINNGDRFELPLPAGDWMLHVYGGDSAGVNRYVHIEPDQRVLDLQLDLPADVSALRFGRPAPELVQIKEWTNGAPTTLEQLRGNVVVLDFWGYWCGACVASMPELMKLHDEFHDKGLVILAVHDDSAGNMAEVDHKCETARKELWNNRNLPFRIALDGGGTVHIPHTASWTAGATDAAYGITGYPSTLVIDKDGTLVCDASAGDPKLRETILRLLAKPRAATQTSK